MTDFEKSTGGNNRGWAKKYQAMVDKYVFLRELYEEGLVSIDRVKGFEDCLTIFHPELKKLEDSND